MADRNQTARGTPPPPTQSPPTRSDRGHPLPRRSTPEKSVTLEHHRLARDATLRAGRRPVVGADASASSRRQSSGDSHETRRSAGKQWFDKSNYNPTATYDDANIMDVDPPFFQRETDSSNELELPPRIPSSHFAQGVAKRPPLRPMATQSSSADDYRSVIDDLTIENKRLKEELKRYKQFGNDMMKKEKLFEIKVHGLPNQKKRELEATLRDFAASVGGSSQATSHRREKPGRHLQDLYSSPQFLSKHASSSSSNSRRPVDSAYASMSTGPSVGAPQSSAGPSQHGRPSVSSRTKSSSDRKVESYLLDTPEGLLPRHTSMTEKEKKKLVVRRLEQLFTGKMRAILQTQNPETVREARIDPNDALGKKARSRDNLSNSNSGDLTEAGGAHGVADGGSGNPSSGNPSPADIQRPTRPRDLDPDRAQIPSENIDYIRHLGLVPPEFLVDKKAIRHDVSLDAGGWVYLNLLCNLAQLHMLSVTPDFIRAAVSEKSTKFQLSADGRKIRWRGGTDGTKFSSDSNSDKSRKNSPADDTDGSTKDRHRKKLKISGSGDGMMSHHSSKESKSGLGQVSASSNSFHYKPLFVRHSSSVETSLHDTASQASLSVLDDGSPNNKSSPWDVSGSGSGLRRKRRRDGAIIYYSGAPFCTDLSGDPGDLSTTYLTSSGQERDLDLRAFQPVPHRSMSGSSLAIRPLSDDRDVVSEAMDMDLDSLPELVTDDGESGNDGDFEFPWCDEPTSVYPIQFPLEPRLEPCGLGGVMPDDHFAVLCHTRHPVLKDRKPLRARSEDITESIASHLASMSTSSPAPQRHGEPFVEMTYLSGRLRRLQPVSLPPPAMYIPPFTSSSDTDEYDDELESDEREGSAAIDSSERSVVSKLGNPRESDDQYPDADTSSNDEEDEDSDRHEKLVMADLASRSSDGEGVERRGSGSGAALGKGANLLRAESSRATAGGGQESGYSSSVEDNAPPYE